jgi:hypothetical protein
MAEFLHEITKKRDEQARIDTMINSQDTWANEEVMEPVPLWQQELTREMQRRWLPPEEERPF